MKQDVTVELAGGKQIKFETGRVAKQASGAALTSSGDNVVLATAMASPDPKEGIDFFPLTVEYRENTYAGGRIPGGFIKREGRPSEKEILTCRQIDRPIRPLFPENFRNETQVVAFVYSADKENDPDVLGMNGASCALALSDIPFHGPVGAVRVGLIDDVFHLALGALDRLLRFFAEVVGLLPEVACRVLKIVDALVDVLLDLAARSRPALWRVEESDGSSRRYAQAKSDPNVLCTHTVSLKSEMFVV